LRDWLEKEGRRYYPRLLKYVSITLVEAGNAVLAVFDETLQKEALVRLTERETDLVRDGFINKEMTTVILRAGVKEVTHIPLLYLFNLSLLPFSLRSSLLEPFISTLDIPLLYLLSDLFFCNFPFCAISILHFSLLSSSSVSYAFLNHSS
jgi:hypothetical protein